MNESPRKEKSPFSFSSDVVGEARKQACRAGGFTTDDARLKTWPLLLGISELRSVDLDWQSLAKHSDEDQVKLDVDRSSLYTSGKGAVRSAEREKDLLDLILALLRRNPELCYFQGFHDIAQVFLLVLGKDLAYHALEALVFMRLRDFMLPSLATSLTQLSLIPAILAQADPKLAEHIAEVRPFFALSATLTLFAHDIADYAQIVRLFDFFLATDAVMLLYLYAALVISRRDDLLSIPADEPDMLHFTLSKLPTNIDLEAMIRDTLELHEKIPPRTLRKSWRQISSHSVLKTTQNFNQTSVSEGKRLFKLQNLELKQALRQKAIYDFLWSWRRPMTGIALSIGIGVLSYWLRTNNGKKSLVALLDTLPFLADYGASYLT